MKTSVPQIAFTYWSGNDLSYLNYLSISTFRHFNPGWPVTIYRPQQQVTSNNRSFSSKEHSETIRRRLPFSSLTDIEGVNVVEINFEAEYAISEKLFHTYLADLTRIKKLQEHGGIWVDMDILFLNPLNENLTELQEGKSVIATSYANTIPTGLIAALPNAPVINAISKEADQIIVEGTQNNPGTRGHFKDHYQSFGPDLWRKHHLPNVNKLLDKSDDTQSYDPELVYPYLWNEMDKYFMSTRFNDRDISSCIGVHWYNGSKEAKGFINNGLAYSNVDNPQTPFEHSLARLQSSGLAIDCSLAQADKPKNRSDLKISIVMGYLNRRQQLINTLRSIERSKHKNIEIIIVDDASTGDQRVNTFIDAVKQDLNIVVVEINREEKTWLNPCMAYNIGMRRATGDIIVVQNPEVMHIGDCIQFVAKNLERKNWLSFNCYGLSSFKENATVNSANPGKVVKLIQSKGFQIGGNSVKRDDVGGWLNHYAKHFVAYHYCGAIYKQDLFEVMNGGFDEDFKNMLGGEDDEFIKRLIKNEFIFSINKLGKNTPFVIHQYHEKSTHLQSASEELRAATRQLLESKLLAMDMAPTNSINMAPAEETPKGHINII